MNLNAFRKILLLLGMIAFILGPGTVFSAPNIESGLPAFMDGSPNHAMAHQGTADQKTDCLDNQNYTDCNDCEMAACNMAGGSFSILFETSAMAGVKVTMANALGAPPNLAGLNRHNLPLPPP